MIQILSIIVQYCTALSNIVKYCEILLSIVKLLGLGVDFTSDWDNNNDKSPHLNFLKGIVLGDKEQGVGIWDTE